MTVPTYSYTGVEDQVEFVMTPFEVLGFNSECTVTYTCSYWSGHVDICDTLDSYGSRSYFDTLTGNYMFHTTNRLAYKPGIYELLI